MPTTLSSCTTRGVLSSSSLFLPRIIPLTPISFVRFPASNSSPLGGLFSTGVCRRTNSANCRMGSVVGNSNCGLQGNVDDGSDGLWETEAILKNESLSVSAEMKSSGWESKINRSSKWVVLVIFSAIVLTKHDGQALWAAIGAVVNSMISMTLKRLLNHERPVSALRADPGMPSSHAQSILYTAVYIVVLVFQWLGISKISIVLAALVLLIGSYLSWVRVSQGFHTLNQVLVGAVVGSVYGALWFWLWHASVLGAFTRYLWVRIPVIVGSVLFSAGFLVYVFRHWIAKERQSSV